MGISLLETTGFRKGLVIPDASAEMPPESLGIATNCDITKSGAVKQRYGTRTANVAQSSFQYGFVHKEESAHQFIVLGTNGSGRHYAGGGTTLVDEGAVTGGPTGASGHAQMLRTALSTADPNTYVASPSNVLYRWDGSAFASVANSPKCRFVAQCGWAERLMYGGFDAGATNGPNGTAVDQSIVGVSNPSEPEVFTTTDTVSLSPGDGERITAILTFNGQTFVFKETSFFVFYGESGSGGALDLLYNQRSGVGCIVPGAAAVSPVGIFFQGAGGIYLTDGGEAKIVSEAISGLFTGELPSWTPYNRLLPSPDAPATKFAVVSDKLYAAVSNTSAAGTVNTVILAYDYHLGAWSYYEYQSKMLAAMPWTNLSYPLLVSVTPDSSNFRASVFHPLVRTDDDDFIPMEFQMRWMQSPDAPGYTGIDTAAIHRLDAWGAGIYNVCTVIDYSSQPGQTKEIDFGDMADLFTDVWPGSDEWGDGTDLTDEWGDGTGIDVWGYAGAEEVWGDGSDPEDVWGAGFGNETDLLRLQPPTHKYAFGLRGRGNFIAVRFTKASSATYCYLLPPRMTVQGR